MSKKQKVSAEPTKLEAVNLVVGDDLILDINELSPYENNPRVINDDAIGAVAESIKKYGFDQRIVVWDGRAYGRPEHEIVVGHTRLLAAKKLGLKQVPVTRVDWLTPDEVTAYRIIDNKSGEKAIWNFEKLQIELKKINMDEHKIDLQFSPLELETVMQADWLSKGEKAAEEQDYSGQVKNEHTIKLSQAQYLTVMAAVNKLKEHDGAGIEVGEALAKICAEWVAI